MYIKLILGDLNPNICLYTPQELSTCGVTIRLTVCNGYVNDFS